MGAVSAIFQTIFVDLFIGIQSMIWVLLGLLLVAGNLPLAQQLRETAAGGFTGLGDIGTLMIVAFTYSLGTIVVRISDALVSLAFFWNKSPFFLVWRAWRPPLVRVLCRNDQKHEQELYLKRAKRANTSLTYVPPLE